MPETDIWEGVAFDKVAHFVVFGVLTLMMIVGFSKQYRYLYLRYRAVPLSLGICLAYGLLIEGTQALVIPDRSLEYGDMLADCLGCAAGYGIFLGIYKS